MTPVERDINNRMIAEFMGWPKEPKPGDKIYYNRGLCNSQSELTLAHIVYTKTSAGMPKLAQAMVFHEETAYKYYSMSYWDGIVFMPLNYSKNYRGRPIGVIEGHSGHNEDIVFFTPADPYHKDWKWLMPVIDKIHELTENYHILINKNFVRVIYDWNVEAVADSTKDYKYELYDSKIAACHQAVVDFIDWYNKQGK